MHPRTKERHKLHVTQVTYTGGWLQTNSTVIKVRRVATYTAYIGPLGTHFSPHSHTPGMISLNLHNHYKRGHSAYHCQGKLAFPDLEVPTRDQLYHIKSSQIPIVAHLPIKKLFIIRNIEEMCLCIMLSFQKPRTINFCTLTNHDNLHIQQPRN